MAELRLVRDSFPDDPALDTAVSRALMERVGAGELPETLRLARPGPMVAFAKRDANAAGYREAVAAARKSGYEAVLRLAGGRAAVFHEGTLALAHAVPDPDPRPGIHERFRESAAIVAAALRRLDIDARVGEVPGEYCPGAYSINARGERKLAGLGQRLIHGAAYVGAVIVAEDAERVNAPLVPVYEALGLDWDPAVTGSVAEEAPGVTLDQLERALVAEYAQNYQLVKVSLDEPTLALARSLRADHLAPPGR